MREEIMTENPVKKDNLAGSRKAREKDISSLIADLDSQDGLVRVRARKNLVGIGNQAVAPLVKALSSKKQWVRWEAAKTLGQIGDSSAAQALAEALSDVMFDVRWLAAQGLIAIGREALGPMFHKFLENPESVWLQEGVHHVLHDINREDLQDIVRPVIAALESFEPSVEAPIAVEKALEMITK